MKCFHVVSYILQTFQKDTQALIESQYELELHTIDEASFEDEPFVGISAISIDDSDRTDPATPCTDKIHD